MKINKLLLPILGISTLTTSAYAQQLASGELEGGTLLPGYSSVIDTPFNGVAAFANNDGVEVNTQVSGIPGKFRLDIRGASTDNSAAGISVYLGDKKVGATSFSGSSASVSSIDFKLSSQPSNTKLKFVLESDNGSNDTFLDFYELHRVGDIPAAPAAPTLPSQGAFDSGQYRSMFQEFGYSSSEVTARLNKVYDQLFHSTDTANKAIFIPTGNDMAYIWDVGNNDVRSEGMSYGMMAAVQMDRQDDFNKLWKWANTYSLNKSGNNKGYFAWKVSTSGQVQDAAPAPDGEEYFVTALFFAANRWGNGSGIYNYEEHANQILKDMVGNGETRYNNQGQLEQYTLIDKANKQIVFSPSTPTDRNWTDPSYHLPAFYELWARWADNNNDLWAEMAVESRKFFKTTANSSTGLSPDYANFDGSPHGSFQKWKETFQYDAWRTISNAAMDYSWFKKDEWQVTWATRLQSFFKGKGIDTYAGLYNLNGSLYDPNNTDHSPGLVAMNAIASLASNKSDAWEFVDAFWNTPVPEGKYRYYDGTLYMFGMLAMSGNYRIYCPNNGCEGSVIDPGPGDGGNNAPVANNDSVSTTKNTNVSKNVISNDSDADGDSISITTYSQAGNGSVSQNGNSLVYTPNTGYTGTDSFTYAITDGTTTSNNATVTVSVTDDGGGTTPTDRLSIPGTVQAEAFIRESGTKTEDTGDSGGGLNVGYIQNGDYLDFAVNVAEASTYTVEARVASDSNGGTLTYLLNGTNSIGSINVSNTGGWQTYQTVSTTVDLAAGNQTIRTNFTGSGYLFNVNYFKFIKNGGGTTPNPDPTPAPSNSVTCEFVLGDDWDSGFSGNIKVTNNGDTAVSGNWSVTWSYPSGYGLTNSWNGTVTGSNPYTATPNSWNSTIQPGQSIEFGTQNSKSTSGSAAPVINVTGTICN